MTTKKAHIIGVPLDHGAGRRGVGMGPSALRVAGLHDALRRLEYEIVDEGDLDIPVPETETVGDPGARFLPLITQITERLAEHVARVVEARGFPLVLGGDHSIAIGTISGLARSVRDNTAGRLSAESPPRLGVLWFDAHADINTPQTSPSGNIHGMPVSCLLGNGPESLVNVGYPGRKVPPERFVQIGLREVDPTERRLLKESGIHAYTMADIDRRGMAAIMDEALDIVTTDVDWLHCSFDIDAVDPRCAPGTGTAKMGGLTYREAHLALEMLADRQRLDSFELVEVNPTLDDKNMTAELAVDFIASALGQRIL